MWFLNFIPDDWLQLFIHGIVILGVALYFSGGIVKKLPFISEYGIFVKILGGILLLSGVFFEGGYGVEMSYRMKTKELQDQIAAAKVESEKTNDTIQSQATEKKNKTKAIQYIVQERIKEVAVKADAECTVDPSIITILNDAALNVKGKQ